MSCAATSHAMLHDALPLVSTLHIENSSQLRLGIVSKQLRDVHSISIYNIFRRNITDDIILDQDTVTKSVHFLSRFPILETVHFWGEDEGSVCSLNSLTSLPLSFRQNQREIMNHILDTFSGAFDCGALTNNLRINGLSCPMRSTHRRGDCRVCKRVCKQFPLEHIFDVYLCLSDDSCTEIIESRQGGENYFRSETRFLQLLGKGRIEDNNRSICIFIDYDYEVRDAMERFVNISQLDVTKLKKEDVFNAIMKRYPNKNNTTYLSEQSFDYLKTTLGLFIGDELLNPEAYRLENLPRMVSNVMLEEEISILHKSMNWIFNLLDKSDDPSVEVQQVIASGVLPKLKDFLHRDDDLELQNTTLSILMNITAGGKKHAKAAVALGAIPPLVRLLSSSHSKIPKAAAWTLRNIARHSSGQNLVLQAGALQPILKLMDQTSDLKLLRKYMTVLVIFCQGKRKRKITKPDFSLVRPSLQKLNELIYHSDEEVLLNICKVLAYLSWPTSDDKHDNRARDDEEIQVVLDVLKDAGVSRLLELFTHENEKIQELALRIVGHISAGNDSQTQFLINNDVLTYLLGLLSNANSGIVKYACGIVSNIAADDRGVQAVIDSGIIPQLIPMMNHEKSDIVAAVCWVISNILVVGSEEQIHFLVKEGFISPLVDYLTLETEVKLVIQVLEGIERVCELGKELYVVGWLNKIEDLKQSEDGKFRFLRALLPSLF